MFSFVMVPRLLSHSLRLTYSAAKGWSGDAGVNPWVSETLEPVFSNFRSMLKFLMRFKDPSLFSTTMQFFFPETSTIISGYNWEVRSYVKEGKKDVTNSPGHPFFSTKGIKIWGWTVNETEIAFFQVNFSINTIQQCFPGHGWKHRCQHQLPSLFTLP